MRGLARILIIVSLIAAAFSVGSRATNTALAQTPPPLTITSCNNLLSTLNQVAAGNIDSVLQCKLGDTTATYNSVFALLQFKTEYTGNQNDYTPPGYNYATAQNWASCAATSTGSCTINDGHQGQTVSTKWINDRYQNNPSAWFRDCGQNTIDQYTGWHCQTTNSNWQPTVNGFGYYRTVTHQVIARFGWDNSATLNGRVNSTDNTVTLWWAKGLHTTNSRLVIDQNVGDVTNINSPDPQTDTVTTSFSITRQTLFTLTGTGRISGTVTATYNASPWQSTHAVSLTANPSTLGSSQTTVLTWGSTGNPTSMTIDQGIGAVTPVSGGSRTTAALTQTVTFTVTGTWANGNKTASATVTIGQPDLTPDSSGATVTLRDTTGHSYDNLPMGASFGSNISSVTISGLKIKNLGPGTFQGSAPYQLSLYDPGNEPNKHLYEYSDSLSTTISPDSSATIPNLVFSADNHRIKLLSNAFASEALLNHHNIVGLDFIVNPTHAVPETDYGNNDARTDNFLTAPAIVASMTSADNHPVTGAVLTVVSGTTRYQSVSNVRGRAIVAPVISLLSGTADYTLTVSMGDVSFPNLTQTVHVDTNRIYDATFSLDGLLIISPQPKDELYYDQNYASISPLGGKVIIANSSGHQFSTNVTNGIAAFSSQTDPLLIQSTYHLISASALAYRSPVSGDVVYTWPEKTRPDDATQDQNNPPSFSYNSSISTGNFLMLIHKECDDFSTNSFKVCFYDTPDTTQLSRKNTLPTVQKEVIRYKTWKNFPLTILTVVRIGSDIKSEPNGYFDPAHPDRGLTLDSREVNYMSGDLLQTTADHEMLHALDYSYGSGQVPISASSTDYKQSLDQQLASPTGRTLWDIAAFNCAYTSSSNCAATIGYSAADLLDPNVDKYPESLATSLSSICVYHQQVIDRLNNITAYWQQNIGTPPTDLLTQRDNLLHRLQGQNASGAVVVPQFQQWYNECLSS
ncbi:MAG TPA: hypothetical protein VLE93_03605 [Candidatus Saccharimonadales bacterium]|nr:hypothetical protein [Candidatus Saccharimonadales bacterium]